MARQTKGRLFTRGKNKNYNLQYYLNGKEIKLVLRDNNGKPITNKNKAQKAADKLLAPYLAKDEVQRREQATAALQSAQGKAQELEKQQNAIELPNAFKLAMQKPRSRKISDKAYQAKKQHWNDYVSFMSGEYPEVKTLDKVTHSHAEKYIQYLIENGKYNRTVTFKRSSKTSSYTPTANLLSPRSINGYLVSLKELFNLLLNDLGMANNPFDNIPKLTLIQEKREAFSLDELKLISKKADNFILALFTIGLCTGLREADICLLKWDEVDLQNNLITRITRKTNKEVTIPIMPPLKSFLKSQLAKGGNSDYVLPEHAEMYLKNDTGITWRVKKFLEGIGIKTTKVPKGRVRAVSVKDVHSLRHSFCYYAGLYKVPLAIVQAVVGHMSSEMTKHYSMHATTTDIKNAFQDMPDIFGLLDSTPAMQIADQNKIEPERQKLIDIISTMPILGVRKILRQLQ